jgi:hypothetical protein
MGLVGTLGRDPALVVISCAANSTVLRGHAVTVDGSTKLARVPGATTERIYGVATSDADTDVLQQWLATGKGGFTVFIKPTVGVTWALGDLVYFNSVALDGTWTNVVGTGNGLTPVGFLVDNKADAYGLLEMGFLIF